jgi:hypothetical protein
MFHWTSRRIEAHVKLCVLAPQVQRAAEMRCQLPWARIAHVLSGLKAVRYRRESRDIVQRSKITAELSKVRPDAARSVWRASRPTTGRRATPRRALGEQLPGHFVGCIR